MAESEESGVLSSECAYLSPMWPLGRRLMSASPANVHSASAVWQAAMAEAYIPSAQEEFVGTPKRPKKRILGGARPPPNNLTVGGQYGSDGTRARWEAKIKKLIMQSLTEKAKAQNRKTVPDGELVAITEDGYIIYKICGESGLEVAGVPSIYRIKKATPTESMTAIKAGKNLCMCRAMGMCSLMACSHTKSCVFCHDPMIIRHYPTDSDWWELRQMVKECRQIAKVENEHA